MEKEVKHCCKYEVLSLNSCKQVFFYSEIEDGWYKSISKSSNGLFVPLGLDLSKYKSNIRNKNSFYKVAFYGNYSWYPNNDGLHYLLESIWPYITERRPDIRLEVAGRNIPRWANKYRKYRSIAFFDEVDNIEDFILQSDIILSPIRIGGGVRLKVLEALALQRPVVATSASREGIVDCDKTGILTANTPFEFFSAIEYLLSSDAAWNELSLSGKKFIEQHYDYRRNLNHFFTD